MTPFQTFLASHGYQFQIQRNGSTVAELKGLPNNDQGDSRKYVGFMPGSDVATGDWLINPSNERFLVVDTVTTYFFGKPSELKAYVETENEHAHKSSGATNIFNIANATGSVIGTQSTVTLNYTHSIQQAKEQIESSDTADKEELRQVITLLEMVVNNQVPPQKGLFSKFADVIQRNSWLTGSITSALLSWLLTQVH